MRRDLDVWPAIEAGVTRRGLLIGAGIAAGAVAAAGIAGRFAPWRDWLGAPETSSAASTSFPAAPASRVRDYTLHSRYVEEPVGYSIAWPPGTRPRRSAARLLRPAGPRRRPADGLRRPRGRGSSSAANRRRTPSSASTAASRTGTSAPPARTASACCCDEVIPLCARRLSSSAAAGASAPSSAGRWAATARCSRRRPSRGLFAAVVAVSPAVWTSYDAMMLGPRDAFDSAADFAKYDVIGHADRLAGVNVRVDCGKQDPFYGYVTYLEAALPEPPSGGYSAGGHDHDYWSRVAPAEAEFIGRALR